MDQAAPIPYLKDPTGKQHNVSSEVTRIGRAVDNDIVIASKKVSRDHARVRREGRRYLLEDLGSANGTYLNGERVLQPIQMRDGDEVTIAGITLSFHDPDVTIRESLYPSLEVDIPAGVVRLDRKPITLSPKEFNLLALLYERKGQVCSKDEIGEAVWPEYNADVYDYQIENLVRRLREKLEPDPGEPLLLVTVRGMGYKLMVI